MSLQLDHAVIAVNALDTAIEDFRHLGFTVVRGGVHANRATHNALITFANGTYLELLASTHDTPLPGVLDFSVMLRHGEGLVGFALRSDDLETEAERLRPEGFAVGPVIPGERRRSDGTLVQWKLARLNDAFAPFLIQDVSPQAWRISTDSALTTHANSVQGLRAVEIAVCDVSATHNWFAALLGIGTDRAPGNVILRASGGTGQPETLYALHLGFAGPADLPYPLELTHGVRLSRAT